MVGAVHPHPHLQVRQVGRHGAVRGAVRCMAGRRASSQYPLKATRRPGRLPCRSSDSPGGGGYRREVRSFDVFVAFQSTDMGWHGARSLGAMRWVDWTKKLRWVARPTAPRCRLRESGIALEPNTSGDGRARQRLRGPESRRSASSNMTEAGTSKARATRSTVSRVGLFVARSTCP